MSDRAPYSRVYWSVMDDAKFVGIYEDDAAFACWVRLLMTADALWPQAPHLPALKKRALDSLVAAQIVEVLPGRRYRIRGLDSERERRKTLATTRGPDGDRRGTVREPDGFAMRGHSQAKPSQEEPRLAEQSARADDPGDAYWQLTGKYPADKALGWIDQLAEQYGGDAVIRALVTAHTADRSPATLIGRTQDLLRAEARQLDRKEREAEKARLREKRAVPRAQEPWQIEYRAALLEKYGEDVA